MRTKLLVLAAAGLMAMGTGAASLAGCSGSGTSSYHPPASQLKEGVNLLDVKDAKWGANTAFVRAGRVVYIETRVGALKPEVYRQNAPDDPMNEMDMRIVDQNGYTFLVVRGGDKLIDPTWDAEIAKTDAAEHLVPKSERDLDWKVAQEGALAVAAALPAGFQDHAFHLRTSAPSRRRRRTRCSRPRRPSSRSAAAGRPDRVRGLQLRRLFHVLDRQVLRQHGLRLLDLRREAQRDGHVELRLERQRLQLGSPDRRQQPWAWPVGQRHALRLRIAGRLASQRHRTAAPRAARTAGATVRVAARAPTAGARAATRTSATTTRPTSSGRRSTARRTTWASPSRSTGPTAAGAPRAPRPSPATTRTATGTRRTARRGRVRGKRAQGRGRDAIAPLRRRMSPDA